MSRRLRALAFAAFGLSCLFASQEWYSVATVNSPNLVFTGFESNYYLGPTFALVLLIALSGLYFKSILKVIMQVATILVLTLVGVLASLQILTANLSAAQTAIEKATGVAGWDSQRENVVTSISTAVWPYCWLIALVAVISLQAMVLYRQLSARKLSPLKEANPSIQAKSAVEDNLWKQTSADF